MYSFKRVATPMVHCIATEYKVKFRFRVEAIFFFHITKEVSLTNTAYSKGFIATKDFVTSHLMALVSCPLQKFVHSKLVLLIYKGRIVSSDIIFIPNYMKIRNLIKCISRRKMSYLHTMNRGRVAATPAS